MEFGRSSASVAEPPMVPKRYVRRSESFSLVQFHRRCVSPGRNHRRLPHPLRQKHLRGVTQEIATDSLSPPLLVYSKQTDARRPAGRLMTIDVQRDIADRGAVPVGNENV